MLNILVAYPYFTTGLDQTLLKERQDPDGIPYRLMIDSGAFTVWNAGREIKLDDYCRFLDSIEFLRPFHAVQLDVFGDHEATRRNFRIMKQRGYDVMPVFTRGESLEHLEEMYAETDYVMFGGIVVGGKNLSYIKWFMERLGDRKIHWLGFTNLNFIKRYRPTSVDSSSCAAAARYGALHLYQGKGRFARFGQEDFRTKPSVKLVNLLLAHGLTSEEIRNFKKEASFHGAPVSPLVAPEGSTHGFVSFVNVVAFLLQSRDIERHTGTHFYQALVGNYVTKIFDAERFMALRGVGHG